MLYCVWLLARMCLFDYFSIPTISMTPTIEPGDKVVVNKLVFGARIYTDLHFKHAGQELKSFRLKGLRRIRHNDIVVFNFPVHNDSISFVINHVYCKRIVGLPGDTVWAKNGHLYNNNFPGTLGIRERQVQLQHIDERTLKKYKVFDVAPHDSLFAWNIKDWGPLYIPRKGDVITVTPREAMLYRMLLEWESGTKVRWDWDSGKVFAGNKILTSHRFQHNYYHICGDYALDSYDSRYWGLVPEEHIIGIVGKIIHANKYIRQ